MLFFDNLTRRICVRDIVDRFGVSADRIWSVLCEHGYLLVR